MGEAPPKKLRVFLSYGHDEYVALAKQIKEDLEQRGHQVWFDAEQLKAGKAWEEYIEHGIEWASAHRECGRILLLMTPHSVRRPDGFCLNELACALDRQLSVIPIMVAQVEPPLSICRIQWLDLVDCLPIQERRSLYDNRLTQLIEALEHNHALNVEGVHSSVRAVLNPLSYRADIAQHLPRFTGKKWLFDKIQQWMQDPNGDRVFWLTGHPGTGKTALSSKLSTGCPQIAAFHICRYGDHFKADPQRVVLSIAWQLATQLPDLMSKLNTIKNLEEVCSLPDATTIFERLIVDPLHSGDVRHPDHPTVILIDGLDEATVGGTNELCEFLATEMERVPSWVRFLLTSRAEQEVSQPLQSYSPVSLDQFSEENQHDIEEYLRQQLKMFESDHERLEEAIKQLMERSECVFLYVEQIRKELEKKTLKMSNISEFPRGLGGIYATYFKRRFKDLGIYKKEHRPALSVVAAACEPIPMDVLAQAFSWDAYQMEEIPDEWGSLFVVNDDRVKPFHRSVVDWLTNKRKAGPHCVAVSEGHRILSQSGWEQFQKGVDSMAGYFIVHLPTHLDADQQNRKLLECITNPCFVVAFARTARFFELARFWQKFPSHILLDTLRESWKAYHTKVITGAGSINVALIAGYIGRLLQHLGFYSDARGYFDEELTLAENTRDTTVQAAALYNMGWCSRQQGRFPMAIAQIEKAMAFYKELCNTAGVAKCLSIKGICHWQQSEDKLALESLWESIKLFEQSEDTRDKAEAYNHLGIIYRSLGEFEMAIDCLSQALDGHSRLRNSAGLGKCYNSIGTCHWWAGNVEKALASYDQANTVNEQFGHRYVLGLTANNLGYIYLDKGDARKSHKFFSKALEIRRAQKLTDFEMMDLSGLARATFHLGNVEEARKLSKDAMEGLEAFETVEDLRRAYYNHFIIMKNVDELGANQALCKARDLVQSRLARIPEESLRETFLNKVPLTKEILELAECSIPEMKRRKLNQISTTSL